jgi:hypothetical protein
VSGRPDGGWRLNIGGFIAEHRERWVIRGCGGGFGWSAQRRNDHGRPRGPLLESLSLDELDEKIRAAEDWSASERSSRPS